MGKFVLVIEDEDDLRATLQYNLSNEGFMARAVGTGAEGIEIARATPPDIVLLDIMLPDQSGTDVCRKLRAMPETESVPIIMVTAKGSEIDRVVGFEVGADDYVVKPFSIRELMLRINAVMRRTQTKAIDTSHEQTFGLLRVNTQAHRVWVNDKEIQLTALEFKLLNTFLSRKGRVQSRDTLLADVWEIQADVTTRTVDTHVKRLRGKLAEAGNYIETVRGVGYRFRDNI